MSEVVPFEQLDSEIVLERMERDEKASNLTKGKKCAFGLSGKIK